MFCDKNEKNGVSNLAFNIELKYIIFGVVQ